MDFRIFHVILWIFTSNYVETCTYSYDELLCTYIETCDGMTDSYTGWYMFQYDYNNEDDRTSKTCLNPINYNGQDFYPVYLVLRNIDDYTAQMGSILIPPENDGNDVDVINIIYSLVLNDNGLSHTPVIKEMASLVRLDLSNNYLTSAVLSNANELRMLSEIILSNNQISKIEVNENAHVYTKLTKLNLSHNLLKKLPDGVFDKFVYLQELNLSYNNIEALSLTTFENIKDIVILNLSNNRLTNINSSLFRFSGLKILNLSGNLIKDVKRADFEHLHKLKTLDLSSNIIERIHVDVFSTMVLLENLYLNMNHLEIIEKSAFDDLRSLISIDLSKNKLKSFPKNLFKSTTLLDFFIEDNALEGSLEKGLFEGIQVTKLDLSNQLLTEVRDHAFYNLTELHILLLNSNNIKSLSKTCFDTLINLRQLDLSNNQISIMDFNKKDLIHLHSLLLNNNNLTEINKEQLQQLETLQVLDLSNNQVTQFEPSAFQSLRNLVNLAINNNLLTGTLETGTFCGLVLLPSLDISRNMLTTIQNASFSNMNKLKELNMSHCDINELQYNSFDRTGYIEILDISYNKLDCFSINTTELNGMKTLLLNNNLIKYITSNSLYSLSQLYHINLARNIIENIHKESFNSLIYLRYLDLSDNVKLHLPVSILKNNSHLNTLILSGAKVENNFSYILEDNQILDLRLSNINARNICELSLGKMAHIQFLNLKYNNISKLQMGDLNGITALRILDLSFNQITTIQPGVFRDTSELHFLNISHNFLVNIGYGIFRGLIHLSILDMSFNKIKDLQTESFYEAESLSELIADHNNINELNAEAFIGTRLSKLSIGNNPLPCQTLVKLIKHNVPFEITAISTDEHSNENVIGITCNKARILEPMPTPENGVENNNILNGLQHIISVLTNRNIEQTNLDNSYLEKIFSALEKFNSAYTENISNLSNLTSEVITINNETNNLFNENNMMLNKIINVLNQTVLSNISSIPQIDVTTAPIIKVPPMVNDPNSNQTADIILYMNSIKKELENSIAIDKEKLNRIESKLTRIEYRTESFPQNVEGQQRINNHDNTKSFFTDTCVGLILFILIGLILYKFYKSRILKRNRFSSSSRESPEAIEHSAL